MSTTSLSTFPLRVVSRRAWYARPKAPPTSASSAKSAKYDEKPWPRSVILGRNVAASLLIPYGLAWGLSMHAPSRELVDRFIPGTLDFLRTYFGRLEKDALAYPETIGTDPNLIKKPPYQLEDEPTWKERFQENMVQQLIQQPIHVKVTVGEDNTTTKEIMLPGNSTSKKVLSDLEVSGRVAIDFIDPQDREDDNEDSTITSTTATPLTSQFYTYSTWFYQAPPQQVTAQKSMSDIDVEISRLEYTIASLEAELQNVLSTRDMDDMRQELAETKSQLSGARWKKRLGMAQ